MPRAPRLDFSGALHHIIARGIERRAIFVTDRDRTRLLQRLAELVVETHAGLYAWALMPNHVHALVRTGTLPLSRLVQRWLGPYATAFNLTHRRCGHLFQNRFKNVLVEEEPYLLELVRYIHLNPVRSRLEVTVDSLDYYPWTGHSVLLGHRSFPAQDVGFVLSQFGATVGRARMAYRDFVHVGMTGARIDLDGGGLRRSAAGGHPVVHLRRGRERWAYDERILGTGAFVEQALARLELQIAPSPSLRPRTLTGLQTRLAAYFKVSAHELASSSLRRPVLAARAVFCDLAVARYGISPSVIARHLSVSHTTIARALARAPLVYAEHACTREDLLVE